jgi:hypothetical protein
MLARIAVDMSIDIGHGPQDERGAHVGIVKIEDPDVK